MEKDNKRPLPCGLLSPSLDWTPEERAAVRAKPEPSNVIVLDDYRRRK